MTLYIEYVIIDNFILDYLILNLIACTFKQKIRVRNKIFVSLIGVLFAIFLPYILPYKIISIFYRLVSALVMMLCFKRYKDIKEYVFAVLLLFFYTAIFGGMIIFVLNMFQIKYTISGVILYKSVIPMGVILFILFVIFCVLKKILEKLSKQLNLNKTTRHIKIVDSGNCVEAIGYCDSGNMVTRDGRPVSIISLDLFLKLYKNYSITDFVVGKIDNAKLKNAKYINISSISKSHKYLSFEIDEMIVENIVYKKTILAVSVKKFKSFDCVLNLKFLGV